MNITWDLGKDVTYEILIANLGGYERAKSKLKDNGSLHSERMKHVLLQYRRQHGIYEEGDYIIFDCELMVFAMWSEVLTNKAYIGYADAEDGILADKSEFKHATDAEIEANKRLEVN